MKNIIFVLLWGMGPLFVSSQVNLDLEFGSSRADYGHWELGINHAISTKWRIGAEFQASDYRYRFIDARAVRNGFAGQFRLLLMGRMAESELLRLDFFAKPGFRYTAAGEEGEQFFENYDFQNSMALTLDPGILVSIKVRENLNFHTGLNMHTVLQIQPEAILEQYPSSFLLAGASWSPAKRWVLFSKNSVGPAAGASGDTRKFFWESSLGIRFILGSPDSQSLILGF